MEALGRPPRFRLFGGVEKSGTVTIEGAAEDAPGLADRIVGAARGLIE